MKATARHRAHRKRRRDSGIVGQATTNEPIDTRVRACYAYSTLVLVGSGGGTTSVRLLRLSRCRVCFLRSFLRSLCTVGIEQSSPPGPRKGEAAGADGNRGTAVPPFPQRYDCYGIENKNNEETSKARGLITRPPNRGQAHSRSTKTATLAAAKTKVLRPPLAAEYAPFYAAINTIGWRPHIVGPGP
jgi:hypothetical protein